MLWVTFLLMLSLRRGFTQECTYNAYEEHNEALLLTPYIEEGKIKEGREAARVSPLLDTIESYSGYFTVNKEYKSNLFFWYFPAEETSGENDAAPVILWLNGGPGVTSMYGLLFENGPISLKDDNTIAKRQFYWSKQHHMIYIDNPVGVGFSFSMAKGLLSNETQISKEIHTALVQFFQLFPELSKNDFFVAGESYAGRYIPPIAYEIHRSNPTSKVNINLKGVMIGDGIVDMEVLHKKGTFLAELGLLGRSEVHDRLRLEEEFIKALKSHDYTTAKNLSDTLDKYEFTLNGVNPYNFLQDGDGLEALDHITSFFNDSHIRNRIHVGKVKFCTYSTSVGDMISDGDGFMNMSPYVEELLEHYRVLYYNGQLDTTLPYPNCEEYAEGLNWSRASEYRVAPRNQWKVGGKLAGFSRSGGNLTLVLVRHAGHMVPLDQPEWALDLITKFVNEPNVV